MALAKAAPPPAPVAVLQATVAAKPEQEIWDATREVHAKLREATLRLGGIVKFPELSDAVVSTVPGLTPKQFQAQLLKWHADGRLVLQVCNDRYLEPRADEGIESPRGLLFYVHLN